MRVNVARIWEDADYAQVRSLCESQKGWAEVYSKKEIKIWTQNNPASNFQMIKVRILFPFSAAIQASAMFPDVPAGIVFDVLFDSVYRHKVTAPSGYCNKWS